MKKDAERAEFWMGGD
jgi:hypothetical protein